MQQDHVNAKWSQSSQSTLQPASFDTWDRKYRLRAADGEPVDDSVDATLERVASALAQVETTEALCDTWHEQFLWALRQGAIPAGRILSNAGAAAYKPSATTINCTVSGTIQDSMDSILSHLHEAGMTLKTGAGIGYDFSTLRPRGAYVNGAGARTSGPLSFMDIFDAMCFTISSAGGRRGAQMATLDVGHPDVVDFVRAKRQDGRLRQFNLSLLITREFLHAVDEDLPWSLAFPVTQREVQRDTLDLRDDRQIVWREWPTTEGYVTNEQGRTACKVYRTVPARQLWDAIMSSTYEFAEPGFILIDTYNALNNNWFCENIRATNPCGEQGLPPYGCCLLGSIDVSRFVRNAFSDEAVFDWQTYRRVVSVFTRMLDNAVEINGLPLAQQRAEIANKRRHGMGILGLGSALVMLGMRYGAPDSLAFTEQVCKDLALTGWQEALALAREKGPAPVLQQEFTVTARMLEQRPEMAIDGIKAGDVVPGRVLHARYSRYMQQLATEAPELVRELAEVGARFTHHSSIAPTGTIALSLANNASNGIEPSFAHHYARNVIREGRKSKEQVEVFSRELLAYRELVDAAAGNDDDHPLPEEVFLTADDITPSEHIAVQAAAQKWVDSSISKTINVPADYPYAEFKDIYRTAVREGLKGCTTFRFNPQVFQGVLVKEADLAGTTYRFVLEDGSVVEAQGNDTIVYDGEEHTAANLYDALKEGYYGRL